MNRPLKLLLDTSVFIWASREPDLLSDPARAAIMDPFNERFVSIASLWEMQIKHGLGKLPLPGNVDKLGQEWVKPLAARFLPVELGHIGRLYDLPLIHRDPFDRILLAQALVEGMQIVSADTALNAYSVPVIW